MEETMILDYKNIKSYFRQTVEFIFLDRVEIVPGVSAEGMKLVSAQDWYFKYHFPENPIMPGVFQMEAVMQTGGLIINAMEGKKEFPLLFHSSKSARIYKGVRPGDILKTEVVLETYRRGIARFHGKASVGGELSCELDFSLISSNELQSALPRGEK
ncbi:MAG: 3-hydroxyacyl-[acyl-carrier-protein] dehydratase FabZ [Lachnospiraceae bacterium]|uniref:3-hydroxyacyl-ACP dehydratase FabZ family protein n=1 Tax=Candidatus Merdisoma sp. JLR.KK011 TaxID=3114299 RepID=UPI002FF300E9|nr:3-hydroxyacyl-[acyl-carrier-protein] dehydratase FabZ [Lachnospiraceae bacterium]